MRSHIIYNSGYICNFCEVSVRTKIIKMPATKVNLSQMVDLAVGTSEVGAVNCNVLHTLLHAMLSRVQTNEKGIAKVWFILD